MQQLRRRRASAEAARRLRPAAREGYARSPFPGNGDVRRLEPRRSRVNGIARNEHEIEVAEREAGAAPGRLRSNWRREIRQQSEALRSR
jgi:hypothetical protein